MEVLRLTKVKKVENYYGSVLRGHAKLICGLWAKKIGLWDIIYNTIIHRHAAKKQVSLSSKNLINKLFQLGDYRQKSPNLNVNST